MNTTPANIADLTTLSLGTVGEHWIEPLDGGVHVLIRALQEQDREREFQFIKRLSPQSRRARFLCTFVEVPASLVGLLMNVQFPLQMAYVALAHDNGELREVGVCRYAKVEGQEQHCESAVVVADDWQGKGLEHALMLRLMNAARRNGFSRMVATDLASNVAMHQLLSSLGFQSHHLVGNSSEIVHECQL